MPLSSAIIERPDLQSTPQRALFGALTAAFWLFWIALWLPLITLGAWLAFGYRFNLHMIELGGLEAFGDLLGVYLLIIAALGGSLIAWARYNELRFRGMDRRRQAPSVGTEQLAKWSGYEADRITAWQRTRTLHVTHDRQGHILHVA